MRSKHEATILPFPAPEPAEVVGVLPFEGGELLVKVTTAGGGSVSFYDPITGVRTTHDLSLVLSVLSALRSEPSLLSSLNQRHRGPAR
jgi:trehalose utilization protein